MTNQLFKRFKPDIDAADLNTTLYLITEGHGRGIKFKIIDNGTYELEISESGSRNDKEEILMGIYLLYRYWQVKKEGV